MRCPVCGSHQTSRERRPNGDSTCLVCGFHTSSEMWDKLLLPKKPQWRDMSSAPRDRSILLHTNAFTPVYVGRYRTGTMGEPQPSVLAWRCDSSGRFANPRLWVDIPEVPKC